MPRVLLLQKAHMDSIVRSGKIFWLVTAIVGLNRLGIILLLNLGPIIKEQSFATVSVGLGFEKDVCGHVDVVSSLH